MTEADLYIMLDPGIRDVVFLLRKAGFDTTDSGDGVSKPEYQREFNTPHVFAVTQPDKMIAEADRMQSLLGAWWRVEASYSTEDGKCILMAFRDVAYVWPAQPPE